MISKNFWSHTHMHRHTITHTNAPIKTHTHPNKDKIHRTTESLIVTLGDKYASKSIPFVWLLPSWCLRSIITTLWSKSKLS